MGRFSIFFLLTAALLWYYAHGPNASYLQENSTGGCPLQNANKIIFYFTCAAVAFPLLALAGIIVPGSGGKATEACSSAAPIVDCQQPARKTAKPSPVVDAKNDSSSQVDAKPMGRRLFSTSPGILRLLEEIRQTTSRAQHGPH